MPNRVCGGYQRSSSFKHRNQQRDWWTPGSSGKASRDGGCGYKKGAAKTKRERTKENNRQRQRERKRADGKGMEEHSETTWQQGIAQRTVQARTFHKVLGTSKPRSLQLPMDRAGESHM